MQSVPLVYTFLTAGNFNYSHSILQWMPGGRGSFVSLEKFVNARLQEFTRDRAKTDRLSTSCLSPYIHYGELSIRFVFFVVSPMMPKSTIHLPMLSLHSLVCIKYGCTASGTYGYHACDWYSKILQRILKWWRCCTSSLFKNACGIRLPGIQTRNRCET